MSVHCPLMFPLSSRSSNAAAAAKLYDIMRRRSRVMSFDNSSGSNARHPPVLPEPVLINLDNNNNNNNGGVGSGAAAAVVIQPEEPRTEPRSVRRRLFSDEPHDPEENMRFLQEKQEETIREKSKEYGFDFATGTPKESDRYEWMPSTSRRTAAATSTVTSSQFESTNVPQVLTSSSSSVASTSDTQQFRRVLRPKVSPKPSTMASSILGTALVSRSLTSSPTTVTSSTSLTKSQSSPSSSLSQTSQVASTSTVLHRTTTKSEQQHQQPQLTTSQQSQSSLTSHMAIVCRARTVKRPAEQSPSDVISPISSSREGEPITTCTSTVKIGPISTATSDTSSASPSSSSSSRVPGTPKRRRISRSITTTTKRQGRSYSMQSGGPDSSTTTTMTTSSSTTTEGVISGTVTSQVERVASSTSSTSTRTSTPVCASSPDSGSSSSSSGSSTDSLLSTSPEKHESA